MSRSIEWPRRSALVGGLGALVASTGVRAAVDDLRADVQIDGRTYSFAARDGEDLGDFRSEIGGFTQRCIRVARPDTPLTVLFRPDRGSDRLEVVFELGRIWSGMPANLNAYTATISSGAAALAKVDVPKHFWFSRWRWQSSPRPVIASIDDLIARHLLPPYAREGAATHAAMAASGGASNSARGLPDGGGSIKIGQSPVTARGAALGLVAGVAPTGKAERVTDATYTIMGMAGLQPRMGGTGERIDIGPVTEPQAQFICTGGAEALDQLRAQAEAGGTCPWHMRDEKTGAPVDLRANSRMSWYDNPRGANPHVPIAASDVTLDVSHEPALAYLPYLLTGDPYHLEDLQFATNWDHGSAPPDYRFGVGQTRGFAWYIRNLATCAKATPASVPRWLMPNAYFEKTLADWHQFMMQHYVNDRSPEHAVFRALEDPAATRDEGAAAPAGTYMPPWQSEFVAIVLGWMVMMGYADWKPFFTWQVGSTIARTNGRSGWHRSNATPYRILLRPNASSPYLKSWAEAWALQAPLWGWAGTDPNTITDKDLTYYFYTRAALVMARHQGFAEAEPCLAWLEGQLQARGAVLPYKWRLA